MTYPLILLAKRIVKKGFEIVEEKLIGRAIDYPFEEKFRKTGIWHNITSLDSICEGGHIDEIDLKVENLELRVKCKDMKGSTNTDKDSPRTERYKYNNSRETKEIVRELISSHQNQELLCYDDDYEEIERPGNNWDDPDRRRQQVLQYLDKLKRGCGNLHDYMGDDDRTDTKREFGS